MHFGSSCVKQEARKFVVGLSLGKMLVDFYFIPTLSHVTIFSSIAIELWGPFLWLRYCKSNIALADQ